MHICHNVRVNSRSSKGLDVEKKKNRTLYLLSADKRFHVFRKNLIEKKNTIIVDLEAEIRNDDGFRIRVLKGRMRSNHI